MRQSTQREMKMAKARRASAKAKKTKRRTKAKRKSQATKRSPVRKSRGKTKDPGTMGKMARAAGVVAETIEETSEMRNKMGSRGGLSEG
jgi:hypothetical protein